MTYKAFLFLMFLIKKKLFQQLLDALILLLIFRSAATTRCFRLVVYILYSIHGAWVRTHPSGGEPSLPIFSKNPALPAAL